MGEGRKDRSGKRQRSSYAIDKSSSDSELAKGKAKGRKGKGKERWPFVDGLTVDELARYRRRRVQGHPKDNLVSHHESEIHEKDLITEYRRAFRASSDDLVKENIVPPVRLRQAEDYPTTESGRFDNPQPSYRDDFKEYEGIRPPTRRRGPDSSLVLVDDVDAAMETETENSKFVAHAHPIGRPPLIRRGTSLKREGEFYANTETCSSYVPYEGQHKAHLVRRPTSLRMEGDMDTMTEKCEKFIEWLNVSRPELIRIPTNLKLEGDLETSTENHEKYVPFVGARRPEILRQGTNFKLDGESNYLPEYADVFREPRARDKQLPKKPETHLRGGGEFYEATETTESYVDPRVQEARLMAELNRDVKEEENRRRMEQEARDRKEEEMKILVSKLEDLKGPPLEIPEYRDAYKDFPRERPRLLKPEDEIGRADGSKISSSPTHSKFSTKIDQDPEYKSKYLDYPRDRPVYRKPPLTLRPVLATSGHTSGSRFDRTACQDGKRLDCETTSEVKSQYVSYGHVPRVETLKMPANLRLEGNLDLQPEYRNAYCTKRDYQACNEPRMHRRRERSLSASRRENYWINNNNGEQFGCVNAADDQDAFQVLSTRVHEESIVGKPPSGSRRDSRGSHVQLQRPSQLDIADRSVLRNRSPSPTYRLHVCNVDDEPQGFRRRRQSPSFESSGRNRSPSPHPLIHDDNNRPYSPSFGRESVQQVNGQSFVVLDNAMVEDQKHNENEGRRRRVDRNCNVNETVCVTRRRPKTPTNWMPPWYDSTNTI